MKFSRAASGTRRPTPETGNTEEWNFSLCGGELGRHREGNGAPDGVADEENALR